MHRNSRTPRKRAFKPLFEINIILQCRQLLNKTDNCYFNSKIIFFHVVLVETRKHSSHLLMGK